MNKKIYALLLLPFAVSGCSGLKAPTFKPYGNSVTTARFFDSMKKSKYATLFSFEQSTQGTANTGVEIEESVKNGSQILHETKGREEESYSFKFDKDNRRSTCQYKTSSDYSTTGDGGKKNQTVSSVSFSRQYQYIDIEEEVESLICVDKAQSVYYLRDDGTPEDLASYYTLYYYYQSMSVITDTDPKTLLKANYYIDDNNYTFELKFTQKETPESGTYFQTISYDYLFQFEVAGAKNSKFRMSKEKKITTTYLLPCPGHIKGEVDYYRETIYHTMNVTIGDYSVLAIDVSSFACRDNDLEIVR